MLLLYNSAVHSEATIVLMSVGLSVHFSLELTHFFGCICQEYEPLISISECCFVMPLIVSIVSKVTNVPRTSFLKLSILS